MTNIVFKTKGIFQDGGPNSEISKLFMDFKGVFLITQWVQNLPEIALSLIVCEINISPCPPKFKMGPVRKF